MITRITATLVVGLTLALSAGNVSAQIEFDESVFTDLDYGLYWFSYSQTEKAVPGQANPYYDPNKDTVIYIHGWQPETVVDEFRESTHREISDGSEEDVGQYWLDQGYNVGILYWNQFADEDEVKDAEAKIHTASGNRDMRWRQLTVDRRGRAAVEYQDGPNSSVTELLTDSLLDNMADFNGGNLRIVGHSLGSQLALTISTELTKLADSGAIQNALSPDRVVLLEHFFSNDAKDYLNGQWTGELGRDLADELISAGVAIEAYRSSSTSSSVLVGDVNEGLNDKTAFSELAPWYYGLFEVAEKHNAAVTWYFWSMGFEPRTLTDDTSVIVPSAPTSDTRILQLMQEDWGVYQEEGRYTDTPSDDWFRTVNR